MSKRNERSNFQKTQHNELGYTKLDNSEAKPHGVFKTWQYRKKKQSWLTEQRSGLVFLVGFMMNKFIEKYAYG